MTMVLRERKVPTRYPSTSNQRGPSPVRQFPRSETEWLSQLRSLSLIVRRYGSLLPTQEGLLKNIYDRIRHSKKRIWIFESPPASGKTHVITLISKFLSDQSHPVAIVVPNSYLRERFKAEKTSVSGSLANIEVVTLAQYVRQELSTYDYVLVDEAHNMKTALELNNALVKTFTIAPEESETYQDLKSRFLPPGKTFAAQQISSATTWDILKLLKTSRLYKSQALKIARDATGWLSFIYVYDTIGRRPSQSYCELKFTRVGPLASFPLPRKVAMLFSASPLSKKELSFYCGISEDCVEVAPCTTATSVSGAEEANRVCLSITEPLLNNRKLQLVSKAINIGRSRSLVLFNNFQTCKSAYLYLQRTCHNLFCIESHSADRMETYNAYMKQENGVLLTASTIFWEGITIEGLKLLIIVDPPYPRPNLLELKRAKRVNGKKDLVRRLVQGLGRVGRGKGESGICILLFDIRKVIGSESSWVERENKIRRVTASNSLLLVHKTFNGSSFG